MSKPGAYLKLDGNGAWWRSSRLLRFWVKAPNTNSEIGTTCLARPRARQARDRTLDVVSLFQSSP
jgi:hypothetical protein